MNSLEEDDEYNLESRNAMIIDLEGLLNLVERLILISFLQGSTLKGVSIQSNLVHCLMIQCFMKD